MSITKAELTVMVGRRFNMSWNEEKQENAYFLKNKNQYSKIFTEDIRKIFEDRMKRLNWSYGFKRGLRGYDDDELDSKWSDFYNGFRLGEDS